MIDIDDEDEKSVTMCCGGKKCPVLSKDKEWISIKDDFGGSVKIPRMHQEAFLSAVRELFGVEMIDANCNGG